MPQDRIEGEFLLVLTTTISPMVAPLDSPPDTGSICVASTTPTMISQMHIWMEASIIQKVLTGKAAKMVKV